MPATIKKNLLSDAAPHVAAQWHPTKNTLLLSEITAGSGKKAWWQCSKGHEWFANIQSRVKGNGCPDCSGRRVMVGVNDLATLHPILAEEWHNVKNEKNASDFQAQSNKKAWWVCSTCSHEWFAIIQSRVKGNGCPACAGHALLPGANDLASQFPEIAAEWHSGKNAKSPAEVHAHANSKVWWECAKCSYVYDAIVNNRTGKGSSCPACAGKVVTAWNNLLVTHPAIAAEWHPTKNAPLTPDNVTAGSSRQDIWWLGPCGHEWDGMKIYQRTKADAQGCPVCSGKRVLNGFNDLNTVAHELAQQWHPTKNGALDVSAITKGSQKPVWWLCENGHEAKASAAKRKGCPVCLNQIVTPGINDLATTHPGIAAEWHPTKNGNLSPQQVVAGTNKNIWWLCNQGHEWQTYGYVRIRPAGCPECNKGQQSSKAERQIAAWLKSLGVSVETNRRMVFGNKRMELDMYVPDKKVAIEYNGLYWHSEDQGKDRNYHYNKWLLCKERGIQLIQIWEDEWNRNPAQVERMLAHKLGVSLPGDSRVMARKTYVVDITKQQAEVFLSANHVQGYASGTHYLALSSSSEIDSELEDVNNIYAVLVLKKEAGTDGKVLNIIRYATSAIVSGGFTKLLKHAERKYQPESFITFSDHCVSDGGLYKNNGFVEDKELPPDYMYVVREKRVHKFSYRLKRFRDDPNLLWDATKSERELAALNNLPRIWDAGKTRWVKKLIA